MADIRWCSECMGYRMHRPGAEDQCMACEENAGHARKDVAANELAAMTMERDALRREVAALIIHTARLGCPRCAEFVKKCQVKKAEDYGKEACCECWSAWAKQQAAQAGKGAQ